MASVLLAWFLTAGLTFADEWKSAVPIPKGAEEVYDIAAGSKLYVFGGLGLDWKAMGMVMEYDPRTDRWMRKRDMPHALHHVALVEVKEAFTCLAAYPAGERKAYVGSGQPGMGI